MIVYDEGRFAYVEGAFNVEYRQCRTEGVHSPVFNVHEFSNSCPRRAPTGRITAVTMQFFCIF